mmetsp:Transcript_77288/g.250152  ORF Transcript_77288/g.250152 Transcript_77288/m.250152 type:complete len:1162 (-) Transcript_77288:249-3734(-)
MQQTRLEQRWAWPIVATVFLLLYVAEGVDQRGVRGRRSLVAPAPAPAPSACSPPCLNGGLCLRAAAAAGGAALGSQEVLGLFQEPSAGRHDEAHEGVEAALSSSAAWSCFCPSPFGGPACADGADVPSPSVPVGAGTGATAKLAARQQRLLQRLQAVQKAIHHITSGEVAVHQRPTASAASADAALATTASAAAADAGHDGNEFLANAVFAALCPAEPCALGIAAGDVHVVGFDGDGDVVRLAISTPADVGASLLKLRGEVARQLENASSPLRRSGAEEAWSFGPSSLEVRLHWQSLVGSGTAASGIFEAVAASAAAAATGGPLSQHADDGFAAWAADGLALGRLQDPGAAAVDAGAIGDAEAVASPGNVQGVMENSAEDFRAFRTNILFQTGIIIVCFLILSIGRQFLPTIYQGEAAEDALPDGLFGWVLPSAKLTVSDVISEVGLDHGMFIQFLNFAIRLLLFVGIPMIVILCPLHFLFGGNAAGQDKLSTFDMGNVKRGSWLCWLHAGCVWYVVVVVQWCVFSQKRPFVEHRIKWLMEMPAPRATTVLVEDVPQGRNTEEDLKQYFDKEVFGKPVVKCVYVVKDTTDLLAAQQKLRSANEMLNIARSGSKRDAVLKAIGGTAETALLAGQMAAQQQAESLKEEIDQTDELNLHTAFVTFNTRRDAAIVMRLFSSTDREEITVSLPPAPADIIWEDMLPKGTAQVQSARETLGYTFVALLFVLFVPIVLWIAAIARWESLHATFGNMGFGQDPFAYAQEHHPEQVALWNGLVGTVVLTALMATVPSFLMWIISVFIVLKAYTKQQLWVQIWYFYFLVVFVLLVTAIGSSDFGLLQTVTFLVRNPLEIFPRLAEKMPNSTHFYLEYLLVQWGVQALNLTRYLNLMKYTALRQLYDPKEAKELSEPEDQDFYGMGSMSARSTLNLTIALAFCTLSPLICIIGLVNFLLARVVHAYLFVYAETRKSDLGGDFFLRQLVHIQQGLFLYIVLMTGVLMEKSDSWVPGAISASSFAYLTNSFMRFQKEFQLREMGLHELEDTGDESLLIYADRRGANDTIPEEVPDDESSEHYKQPELPPPSAGGAPGTAGTAGGRPSTASAEGERPWTSWLNCGAAGAQGSPKGSPKTSIVPAMRRQGRLSKLGKTPMNPLSLETPRCGTPRYI